jgi:hypothetical protein
VKPFNLGLPDASEAISSHGQQQQLSEEVIVKQRLASPFPRFSVFLWAMKRPIVISHDFHFSLCVTVLMPTLLLLLLLLLLLMALETLRRLATLQAPQQKLFEARVLNLVAY